MKQNINLKEKDIETKPCNVDDKLKLPFRVAKLLCQTCRKLPNGILFPLFLNHHSTENKQGLKCACSFQVDKNRMRERTCGQRITYNQVCEWTQYVLEFAKLHHDKILNQDNQSNLPQDLPSTA